ncbi:MAG: M1 family metallopeptidase [Marinilabiliaceae bacterium]|jgi:aminopeptidase N|nr:M1 family metallopeptidase [Marinilabiliaceae bacterium]
MKYKKIFFAAFLFLSLAGYSQFRSQAFTRQDTLRGSITPEREWWDLTFYHLDINTNPADSSISGQVLIRYTVLEEHNIMQIDLQPPLLISSVKQDGQKLKYKNDGNVWFVELLKDQQPGNSEEIIVSYGGRPKVSRRPPWDHGITWQYDKNGNPFYASTCQGGGASVWWPCKDHMYDEPDSMRISVSTPGKLMNVSNGRLTSIKENSDGTKTWSWYVSNPINNYGVNINVGDYANFSEVYQGESGPLDMDYYVLSYNLDKAKEHFKQAPMMMEAFEHWFGPYPFYEDSYKLVETPYPGMEHQSSVTYGNGFRNGYGGRDVSQTGWGDKFDFILVHESGHEWFANNITYKDIADMWIHESFIAYSEGLFTEYWYGKEAGFEYLRGVRSNIVNDRPIIGIYNVNSSGSGDMYQKGATMLHMIRQIVNNDENWRNILRGLNKEFWHQTVTTEQIEKYMDDRTDFDLQPVFDQFLRDTRIPSLEYRFLDGRLVYRWGNTVRGYNMPVKVYLDGKETWLSFKPRGWNIMEDTKPCNLVVDKDFYVSSINLMGEQ